MFQMPMSSPMMKTMLGFCCCAAAGALAAVSATNVVSKPRQKFLAMVIFSFLLHPRDEGTASPSNAHCAPGRNPGDCDPLYRENRRCSIGLWSNVDRLRARIGPAAAADRR